MYIYMQIFQNQNLKQFWSRGYSQPILKQTKKHLIVYLKFKLNPDGMLALTDNPTSRWFCFWSKILFCIFFSLFHGGI